MGTKIQRTSSEHATPRGGRGSPRRSFYSSTSPSSSFTESPSPPRRRHALRQMIGDFVHPRSTVVPEYRGVRYRHGLGKFVSEIRPTRCLKKIWLGTYDTAREAARAFDIGNLCCKKNLPLNFADSPRMLKKISSHLTPEAQRKAIATLAKEVARMERENFDSNSDGMVPTGPVAQIHTNHEDIAQHSETREIPSYTYTEQPQDNVCTMEEATSMNLREDFGHHSFPNGHVFDDDLISIEDLFTSISYDCQVWDSNTIGDGYYPP